VAGAIRGFGDAEEGSKDHLSRRWGLCMKRGRACGSLLLGALLLRMRRRPCCNLWKTLGGRVFELVRL
jgi:hypothetical protein